MRKHKCGVRLFRNVAIYIARTENVVAKHSASRNFLSRAVRRSGRRSERTACLQQVYS